MLVVLEDRSLKPNPFQFQQPVVVDILIGMVVVVAVADLVHMDVEQV